MKLRAHHLLCMRYFQGKGYNKKFVDNFYDVLKNIKNENQVYITNNADKICNSCPHNKKGKCTKKGAKSEYYIMKKDNFVIQQLGLENGQSININKINKIVKSNLKKLKVICKDCEWNKYCN